MMNKIIVLITACLLLMTSGHCIKLGGSKLGKVFFTLGDTATPPPPDPDTVIGAEWYRTCFPDTAPIGGGIGYSDTISMAGLANNHTSSWIVGADGTPEDSLVAFLAASSTGDTIYIHDNVSINRTGDSYLTLKAGVILASGRGTTKSDTISWGGLIYKNDLNGSGTQLISPQTGSRVTGLRLRGGYSLLDCTFSPSDSANEPVGAYDALYIEGSNNSIELDNCECYGFPGTGFRASGGTGHYIHHNYFHDMHQYQGYVINVYGAATTYLTEANLIDDCLYLQVFGGGAENDGTHGNNIWNIYGPHHYRMSVNYHADADSSSCDTITNCSFYGTKYFSNYKFIDGGKPARDTVLIKNVWSHKDSTNTIYLTQGLIYKMNNCHYSATPPQSMAGLLPTAAIVSSVDSGTAPLTVKFTATGSDSPATYNWVFGDSCLSDNRARVTVHNDTVSHTFTEIGKYMVELMVIDGNGLPAWTYKTIKVKPASGKWLSAWLYNNWEGTQAGYYKAQLKIDNWTVWEKDIAGNNAWEHVIVEVTDTMALKDSFDLTFQLLCTRDTASFWQPMAFIDDIHIFGANVRNGDFDSAGVTWSGDIYGRTDGFWVGSYSGGGEQWYMSQEHNCHCRGYNSWWCGTMWSTSPHKAGYYGKTVQRVDNPDVP